MNYFSTSVQGFQVSCVIWATRLQHHLRCLLAPPDSKVCRKHSLVVWTRIANTLLTPVQVPEALLRTTPIQPSPGRPFPVPAVPICVFQRGCLQYRSREVC